MVDGKELTMGVSGKLWKNVLVMYDRQTDTLWSHLTGEGIVGPLKGKKLKIYPALFTTFDEWRQLYPKSRVLNKKKVGGLFSFFRSSSRDPYEGYYYSRKAGIIPQKHRDNRLHPKTFIVAVALAPAGGGEKRAKVYPFAALNRDGVVNDVFAGRNLLVTYCERARTGVVFDRKLGGKTLTFAVEGGKSGAGGDGNCRYMRDRETNSRWLRLTGRAVSGPMKGKKLEQIPSTLSFWYGWKDYYPRSEIYGGLKPK